MPARPHHWSQTADRKPTGDSASCHSGFPNLASAARNPGGAGRLSIPRPVLVQP